jgi:hypothetical protein
MCGAEAGARHTPDIDAERGRDARARAFGRIDVEYSTKTK